MLNKNLLLSHMAKRGDTGIILSNLMNMSQQTFSAKLNEKDGKEFNKTEINFFINRYDLNPDEVFAIFFTSKVS